MDTNPIRSLRAYLQHTEIHPSIRVQQYLDKAWETLTQDTRSDPHSAWSLWASKLGSIDAL